MTRSAVPLATQSYPRRKKCQTVKDAELLVYLVEDEKDIYIGVRRFAT
jgi:hypothetical protein